MTAFRSPVNVTRAPRTGVFVDALILAEVACLVLTSASDGAYEADPG
ncbi:hypothetical protein WBG06_05630 [Nocardioides sp. CCNWLW239]